MNKLFVYGTLLDSSVLKQILDRVPRLYDDRLEDFEKLSIAINDNNYLIAKHKKSSAIGGSYFYVSDEELIKLDLYETDAYDRIEVVLASGVKSFVYCSS